MPTYFYTAKSLNGEISSGTEEAKNERELARYLHSKGYVLIKAGLKDKKKKKEIDLSLSFLGVSPKEKLFFTRNLRIMIISGVSIPQALDTLSAVSKNKKFKEALLKIKTEIIKGKSFSEAIKGSPDIFSELFINMIKAGEEAGTIDKSLESLAHQIEREVELKSKIIGAMIYPAVIISAMIAIGMLMLIIVIPPLAATFEDLGTELPFTTKAVIFIGTFLAKNWFLIPLIPITIFLLFRRFSKSKKGGKFLDAMFLKMPVISSLVKEINTAFTSRTLASLISAGVPIVRALEITANSLSNFYFRQALKESTQKVMKGERLSDVLMSHADIYPLTIIQMLKVGEETGETAQILDKMADFYEEEVTNATKNISSVIEPILMLIVGGAVGFFAISIIQPIYSMIGSM